MKAFGERLRSRRKELGKTISECASAFGMSQPAWTFWEQGSREPKLDDLVAVSSFLETTPNDLLGITETLTSVTVNGSGNVIGSHAKVNVVTTQQTNCKTCPYKAAVKRMQKAGITVEGV